MDLDERSCSSAEAGVAFLSVGTAMEYRCRDDRGRPQGHAIVKVDEVLENDCYVVTHYRCQDEYYQYYVQMKCPHGTALHLCRGPPGRCKVALGGGRQHELIHVGEWRLVSCEMLLGLPWVADLGIYWGRSALKSMRDLLSEGADRRGGGMGLDREIERERGKAKEDADPGRLVREAEPVKKRRKGLTEHLEERVRQQYRSGSVGGDRGKKKEKKKEKKRRKKDAKRKKKDIADSSSSDSTSSSGSGESPFQLTSARGGELWRIAQKKPERLTERSLDEMSRYLAERNEYGDDEKRWSGQKIVAYLNQVVLVNNPPQKIGVRSHRELVTLAMVIDQLLEGQVARGLDILMQRFKAVEASLLDGG